MGFIRIAPYKVIERNVYNRKILKEVHKDWQLTIPFEQFLSFHVSNYTDTIRFRYREDGKVKEVVLSYKLIFLDGMHAHKKGSLLFAHYPLNIEHGGLIGYQHLRYIHELIKTLPYKETGKEQYLTNN